MKTKESQTVRIIQRLKATRALGLRVYLRAIAVACSLILIGIVSVAPDPAAAAAPDFPKPLGIPSSNFTSATLRLKRTHDCKGSLEKCEGTEGGSGSVDLVTSVLYSPINSIDTAGMKSYLFLVNSSTSAEDTPGIGSPRYGWAKHRIEFTNPGANITHSDPTGDFNEEGCDTTTLSLTAGPATVSRDLKNCDNVYLYDTDKVMQQNYSPKTRKTDKDSAFGMAFIVQLPEDEVLTWKFLQDVDYD